MKTRVDLWRTTGSSIVPRVIAFQVQLQELLLLARAAEKTHKTGIECTESIEVGGLVTR
jgi:hypothetical protein